MCKLTPVLLGVSLVMALLGYLLYVPLPPEDFKQPISLHLELAGIKSIDLLGQLADYLGFQYTTVSRAVTLFVVSLLPSSVDDSVQFYDTEFEGVPVRVYLPLNKLDNSRAVIYFHGGGFRLGDIVSYHSQVFRITKELNAVAVSVGLAPEHVFPAAVDDSEAATQYFIEHASDYGVDPQRVAVMGDSAGGNLATVVSMRLLRKNFKPLPKMQVLIYPWLQMLTLDLPSFQANQDVPVISRPRVVDFITSYVFGSYQYQEELLNNSHVSKEFRHSISHIMDINLLPDDEILQKHQPRPYKDSTIWEDIKSKFQNPDLSPILADDQDLARLPMTYMSSCQYDVLRDEQLIYVARLRKAGVKVIHDHLRSCYHSWTLSHESSNFRETYSKLLATISLNL